MKNESYFNLKQLVQATHGSQASETRHVGDFGNIEANGDGVATIDVEVDNASLFDGLNLIVGLPVVVHALPDDLGSNPDSEDSLKTGKKKL